MGDFSRIYKTDMTDRQMMDFWTSVQLSRRDRKFAYCLPKMDGEGFVKWMRRDDVHPWGILYRGIPVALCLLTNREGKKAEVHFCLLPVGSRRYSKSLSLARAIGLYALSNVLWEENESGKYVIDTLIGVTPASNRTAIKYAGSVGGKFVARVPDLCWYYDTNENVDGIMTVFNRNNVPRQFKAL